MKRPLNDLQDSDGLEMSWNFIWDLQVLTDSREIAKNWTDNWFLQYWLPCRLSLKRETLHWTATLARNKLLAKYLTDKTSLPF